MTACGDASGEIVEFGFRIDCNGTAGGWGYLNYEICDDICMPPTNSSDSSCTDIEIDQVVDRLERFSGQGFVAILDNDGLGRNHICTVTDTTGRRRI